MKLVRWCAFLKTIDRSSISGSFARLSRENPLVLKPASHVLLDSSTRPHRVELHFVICASSLVQYALITCAQCVCAWPHTKHTHIHTCTHDIYRSTHNDRRNRVHHVSQAVKRHRDRATSVFYGIGHHTGMKDVRIARIHTHSSSSYIHTLVT